MQWRNLIKSNLAYAVGSVANSAALFLLVPFFVNALSTEGYGTWALLEISTLVIVTIMSLGLEVGLMRDYWFLKDETARAELAGTILTAVLGWGAFLFGISLLTETIMYQANIILFGVKGAIVWATGIAWAEAMFTILLSIFRIREMASLFVALSVVRMLLFVGSAIGLVYLGFGIKGALAGRLAGVLVTLVVAGLLARRYITPTVKWKMLKRSARYGLPLLPYNMAMYVLLGSDRYTLEIYSNLETVAVYTFAYKVATVLDVTITRPFNTDWVARRFKIATLADASRHYARILSLYLFVATAVSLILISGAPLVYDWFAPEVYRLGIGVVPVILIAYILYGLEGPVNVGIMLKDRTQYMPVIGWLAAGVCLVLNFLLIPRFGMLGAAWATVIGYAVHTVGLGIVSYRVYPIPYSIWKVATVVLSGFFGFGGILAIEAVLFAGPLFGAVVKLTWVASVIFVCGYVLWRSGETTMGAGARQEPKGDTGRLPS